MHIQSEQLSPLGKVINFFGLYNVFAQVKDTGILFKRNNRTRLYRYYISNALIKHFGGLGHGINYKTGNIGYGWLHYSFITIIRPKRILCIGSRRGFIPAICAMACKDGNFGMVDFVDVGKDVYEPNSWGGEGFWKKNDPDKHFSLFYLNKFIKTYIMTSEKYAKKYHRTYGYIYIDGDHSYAGVKHDFNLFWPLLKKNGVMCFHDIGLKNKVDGHQYGVWRFWKELSLTHTFSFIDGKDSIGFIQK